MTTNQSSTKHPHEPRVPPILNAEGACLVCGIEWRVAELAQALTREFEAVALLGEVCDWLGTPDWTGPQLPNDLARRIAAWFTGGTDA